MDHTHTHPPTDTHSQTRIACAIPCQKIHTESCVTAAGEPRVYKPPNLLDLPLKKITSPAGYGLDFAVFRSQLGQAREPLAPPPWTPRLLGAASTSLPAGSCRCCGSAGGDGHTSPRQPGAGGGGDSWKRSLRRGTAIGTGVAPVGPCREGREEGGARPVDSPVTAPAPNRRVGAAGGSWPGAGPHPVSIGTPRVGQRRRTNLEVCDTQVGFPQGWRGMGVSGVSTKKHVVVCFGQSGSE